MMPSFRILHDSPQGRVGQIITPHGTIDTPNFIFCATKGSVRGLGPWDLERIGVQVILSNTYHMMVHPGISKIRETNGVHGISGWNGPMLTDSGGFQVFCLGHGSVSDELKGKRASKPSVISITEEGVTFRSYREGEKLTLTPEVSIELQQAMGADLIVNFDECTPFHISYEDTRKSMERTHRWQDRGYDFFHRNQSGKQGLYSVVQGGIYPDLRKMSMGNQSGKQGLYSVVQGGIYPDLRKMSMEYCNSKEYFGYAVGGSLGQNMHDMHSVLQIFQKYKQQHRPVHLLGMGGYIREIFEALQYGIDTFDCVHPTRVARHGLAIGRKNVDLRRKTNSLDPIDKDCQCMTCKYYSRAALHTLVRAGELTAIVAIVEHNVTTMVRLMSDIRAGLRDGNIDVVKRYWCVD